jgi:hypothetical protein
MLPLNGAASSKPSDLIRNNTDRVWDGVFSPKTPNIPGLPNSIGRRNRAPGNGIFRCRDGRLKIGLKDRRRLRRPKERNNTGENPAETACFRSRTISAVRTDWMVETVGTKLPTPHPVIETISGTESGTEIFDAETGGRNGLIRAKRDGRDCAY